jgi:hypothetical protein
MRNKHIDCLVKRFQAAPKKGIRSTPAKGANRLHIIIVLSSASVGLGKRRPWRSSRPGVLDNVRKIFDVLIASPDKYNNEIP